MAYNPILISNERDLLLKCTYVAARIPINVSIVAFGVCLNKRTSEVHCSDAGACHDGEEELWIMIWESVLVV